MDKTAQKCYNNIVKFWNGKDLMTMYRKNMLKHNTTGLFVMWKHQVRKL